MRGAEVGSALVARLLVFDLSLLVPICLAVRWYDNVPVLGWLWLRGKCRDCKAPISATRTVTTPLLDSTDASAPERHPGGRSYG